MSTKEQGFKIPAPADQPRFHEYAAGFPGDYRPIEQRFADRMIEEHELERSPAMLAALSQAFRAGRACEAEAPDMK